MNHPEKPKPKRVCPPEVNPLPAAPELPKKEIPEAPHLPQEPGQLVPDEKPGIDLPPNEIPYPDEQQNFTDK